MISKISEHFPRGSSESFSWACSWIRCSGVPQ